MATLVTDLETHFTNLTATNEICDNFNATFSSNGNLFIGVVPATPTDCVTFIPYPGAPPSVRLQGAQTPNLQIRVRATTWHKGYLVTQSIMNYLHNNDRVTTNMPAKAFALESHPIFLKWDEEEYPVFVCNFQFKTNKYTVS